jgi:hypothetical protein
MAAMSLVTYGGAMAQDKPANKATAQMEKLGGAMAEDKQANKATAQMEKLGALRGRLMLKLAELGKAVDRSQNGAGAMYETIDRIRTKVSGEIEKQLQDENAKGPEMLNRVRVDTLTEKGQKLAEMGNEFTQKDWPAHEKTSDKLRSELEALTQVFASVKDAEMLWINSGLDLEGLILVLMAIDGRVDTIKVQAAAAVSDLKAKVPAWETMTK